MTHITERFVNDLQGKHFVIFGWKSSWPGYLRPIGLEAHLAARGAIIQEQVDAQTDYVVLDRGREKGKARAIRKIETLKKKGHLLEILTPPAFFQLLRPDINGLRFAFTGGFSRGAADLDGGPAVLLERTGAVASPAITPDIDCVVVGERRAQGKTADLRKVEQLNKEGAHIEMISELTYLDLLSVMNEPGAALDFPGFVVQLRNIADSTKLDKAIKMLKKESFKIYADIQDDSVAGIVKSQSRASMYYASWIHSDGSYGCYDHMLDGCMGLQGAMCKHILVLLMGLTCNGNLNPDTALSWVIEAGQKPPKKNEDPSAQMLLRYKGVEAGEIDWRPTETIPEDYYIL